MDLAKSSNSRWKAIKDFFWGFFFFDFYKSTMEAGSKYEDALNLLLLGQLLGVPLMNSTLTLKLLPYLFPELAEWRRRQLKEVEIIESAPPIS
ncbi:MAG: hypothetical protein ACE5MB_04820 [Anaerolineae bacterium]